MDIIAIDRCADIESIPYPLATPEDLEETGRQIVEAGGSARTVIADVRGVNTLQDGIDAGIAEFGDVDVVVANAGVVGVRLADPLDEHVFRDIADVNLLDVWHTGSAAAFAYAASKHGVVGLMRSASCAYAQHNIRVNSEHPTGVATPMIFTEHMARVFESSSNLSATPVVR
jgi:NAD(P)-dependent dehydrogenase (short-subunit alcohol dehydrogenase family)